MIENNAPSDRENIKLYAVFRNGFRVSDTEYESATFAQAELDYWKAIVKKNPDGSKLEVRQLYYRS